MKKTKVRKKLPTRENFNVYSIAMHEITGVMTSRSPGSCAILNLTTHDRSNVYSDTSQYLCYYDFFNEGRLISRCKDLNYCYSIALFNVTPFIVFAMFNDLNVTFIEVLFLAVVP